MTATKKIARARKSGARSTTRTRRKLSTARVAATPLREVWLAGLGAAVATGEAANDFVDLLVKRGREAEPKVVASAERAFAAARRGAARTADQLGAQAREVVDQALERLGVNDRSRSKNVLHRLGDLAEAIL